VLVAYFLLGDDLHWVLLPIGVAWGLLFGAIGTYVGGAVLDRRAVEVLDAVTPRRS
jgi:ABC-2 type transport system permease protein